MLIAMHELICYAKSIRALLWLTFFVALFMALSGISEEAKRDTSKIQPVTKRIASHSSELMTGSLALVIILDKLLATRDKRIKRALEECCDRMRDDVFGDGRRKNDATQYHDRVTIFKACKWSISPFLPPTRGLWLVPIARSHAEPTSSSSFFWCPVDRVDFSQLRKKKRFSFFGLGIGEPRTLGVAGSALKMGFHRSEELPDLLGAEWNTQSCQDYADKTHTYADLVSRRRYVARSYFAKRIGPNERNPIGVAVFDSYAEKFLRDVMTIATKYEKILSSLLEKPFVP